MNAWLIAYFFLLIAYFAIGITGIIEATTWFFTFIFLLVQGYFIAKAIEEDLKDDKR